MLPAQLESLMGICHAAGWPFLPAIVFHEPALGHVGPAGTREHLVGIARKLGTFVSDVNAFIRTEQDRVFEWAPTAPPHLPGEAVLDVDRSETRDVPDGKDGLSAERIYLAILQAARKRLFISYGDLAAASGVAWGKGVLRQLVEILDRISIMSCQLGWPLLPVIVVEKKERETGRLKSTVEQALVGLAARFGREVGSPDTFVPAEQKKVFAWASHAPHSLADVTRDSEALVDLAVVPFPVTESLLLTTPERRFWLVAVAGGGQGENVEQFISEKKIICRNSSVLHYFEHMRRGDAVILKSSFNTRSDVPFDSKGHIVSAMKIYAIGFINYISSDGEHASVNWRTFPDPKIWYFYTFAKSLYELNPGDRNTIQLIRFSFCNEEQDIDYWINNPYWAERFGDERREGGELQREDGEAFSLNPLPLPPYTLADIVAEGGFLAEDVLARALDRWKVRRNLILQGPPGTGKSWLARRLAAVLLGSRDPRAGLRAVQFHPALSYEEFVRGWRPEGDGRLALVDGPFLECVTAARAEPDRPFVLLIEEINRGNPARIFGDMLTLIEDSKRRPDEAIELSARRDPAERIFVPDNLFLLGTMNIADRSLAMVDFALRRRFAFLDLAPAFNERWQDWCVTVCGLDAPLVGLIRDRLTALNAEIAGDRGLGPQFRIGHSFLTPRRDAPPADTALWFRETVETEIGPLLEEYWFDNPDRAREAVDALVVGF
ncbi:McrB family protein [Segnochrobactraceae bacterium EtOH-i3]